MLINLKASTIPKQPCRWPSTLRESLRVVADTRCRRAAVMDAKAPLLRWQSIAEVRRRRTAAHAFSKFAPRGANVEFRDYASDPTTRLRFTAPRCLEDIVVSRTSLSRGHRCLDDIRRTGEHDQKDLPVGRGWLRRETRQQSFTQSIATPSTTQGRRQRRREAGERSGEWTRRLQPRFSACV